MNRGCNSHFLKSFLGYLVWRYFENASSSASRERFVVRLRTSLQSDGWRSDFIGLLSTGGAHGRALGSDLSAQSRVCSITSQSYFHQGKDSWLIASISLRNVGGKWTPAGAFFFPWFLLTFAFHSAVETRKKAKRCPFLAPKLRCRHVTRWLFLWARNTNVPPLT